MLLLIPSCIAAFCLLNVVSQLLAPSRIVGRPKLLVPAHIVWQSPVAPLLAPPTYSCVLSLLVLVTYRPLTYSLSKSCASRLAPAYRSDVCCCCVCVGTVHISRPVAYGVGAFVTTRRPPLLVSLPCVKCHLAFNVLSWTRVVPLGVRLFGCLSPIDFGLVGGSSCELQHVLVFSHYQLCRVCNRFRLDRCWW